MADIHDAAQRGFTEGAAYYSRARPGYPEEILKWLQTQLRLTPGKQVLELGAGTGQFTRCLSLTGAHVYVVEPVAAMLSHLLQDVPAASPVPGSAESIDIEANCVDAVVCAQSFHWFATRAALTEVARVLKPGGVLGLVWNIPDECVPWVAALESILRPFEATAPHAYRRGTWRSVFPDAHFSQLQMTEYPHSHVGPVQRVIIERAQSLSYVAILPPSERTGLLERLQGCLATQPDTHGRVEVEFPYRTQAWHCSLLSGKAPEQN